MESRSKKTLLFGGSFNPIHLGHLYTMTRASKYTDYEKVVIMPANISAFKLGNVMVSPRIRLHMIDLALKEYPLDLEVVVSELELNRKGVSYTYDTVLELYKEMNIKGKLGILIGSDIVPELYKWHRIDELRELVDFVVLSRNNEVPESDQYTYITEGGSADVSSTEIRNGDLRLLTDGVRDFILQKELYRN